MSGVRVCARFRPPNKREQAQGGKIIVKVSEDHIGATILDRSKKTYVFDRVFPYSDDQEAVYKYTGEPLVEQVLAGFNCTIFAFGQTGSGKTYTMQGVDENPGIIPRMVDHLFECIMNPDGFSERCEFMVRVQYVEIYNEKIRDLLEPGNADLRVREHRDKGVYIEDAARPFIGSPEEVMELMDQGAENRAVTSTNMNDTSSRSHAVFMMLVEQRDIDTEAKKTSKLMLVDLAGSEKVRKTGAVGSVLKEAQNINRSLSCLGQVINCLTEARSYVPYRDSKLTRLLSDSLGGNSKTCIIVTASPCSFNLEETISTMRFGQRCKRVKNKPKVNKEISVAEYKKIVAKMERKIQKLEEANQILISQVEALKKALKGGASGVDIDKLLKKASAAANTGVSMNPEMATKQVAPTNNDLEQQIMELEDKNENYEDQIQDFKNELEIAENQRDALRDELQETQRHLQSAEETRKKLASQTGQLKFYKEKLEYVEKEHENQIEDYKKRLREAAQSAAAEKAAKKNTIIPAVNLESVDIVKDKPVAWETFEKFRKTQEIKYEKVIQNMKQEMEEKKSVSNINLSEMSEDERQQTVHKLVKEREELRQKQTEMTQQNEKYVVQMKAFAQREQYNDKLRRNWQTQLRQMEQALLLSNQINNQNRAKYQQTITEKDSEIAKLRAYVTHHLQRQRTMRRGTRIAKPINRNRGQSITKNNVKKTIVKRTPIKAGS